MVAAQTTLTIEGLDADTLTRLESEATRRGMTLPVLARELLRQSADTKAGVHHDLDTLAGTWSEEVAKEFDAATASTRQVDEELWR